MIAIVDGNNFYCSCHRVFEPELRYKPVLTLSNNDGCVIAMCNQCKEWGIEMGDAYFLHKDDFARKGIAVRSSNYALYADMNKRIIATLKTFSPTVEVYSIDEAFMCLKNMRNVASLDVYCQTIKNTVYKHTGVPVGIGVGSSKALAKAANKYAKKVCKDTGVFVIDTEEKRRMVLEWTPLNKVWGIGHRLFNHLDSYGIKTAWDLSMVDKRFLQHGDGKRFTGMGVKGLRLLSELQGIPVSPVLEWSQLKKNITTGRSFPDDVYDFQSVFEAVSMYTHRCGEQLRQHRACAGQISVGIITNTIKTDRPQYGLTVPVKLPTPVDSTRILLKYAHHILQKIWKPGYGYKKVIIEVSEIVPRNQIQQALFSTYNRERDDALMSALDKVNQSMGQDRLRFASMGTKHTWALKREFLSHCFTTNWHELPTAKA